VSSSTDQVCIAVTLGSSWFSSWMGTSHSDGGISCFSLVFPGVDLEVQYKKQSVCRSNWWTREYRWNFYGETIWNINHSSRNKYVMVLLMTKHCGQVVNTPALYLGGPKFKSCPRDRLSWLMFIMVFLRTSREMPGYYLKLGHDCFLPHFFPIPHSPVILSFDAK
jgi:hypothetical protein